MNLQVLKQSLQRVLGSVAVLLGLSGMAAAAPSYCTATYTITNAASNQIGIFNFKTNTVVPEFAAASTNSNALTQSVTNGNLYYIERTANALHKIDINTGADTNVGPLAPAPVGVVVGGTTDASGNYYIYAADGTFGQVNLGTGAIVTGAYKTFTAPAGYVVTGATNGDFAIDKTGQAYVIVEADGTPTGSGLNPGAFLWKLDLTTGSLSSPVPVRSSPTTQWALGRTVNGLSIDPFSGVVLLSSGTGPDGTSAGVYAIDLTTGVATVRQLISGLTDLGTCAQAPDLPSLTKSFAANPVSATPAKSTLTITVTNPNKAPIYLQSALVDALPTTPSPMVIATPNNLGGTCTPANVTATAGSASVTLAAGTKIAVGSCTITVDVQVPAYGSYVNTLLAGALDTTAGANSAVASATLVNAPPTISGIVYEDFNYGGGAGRAYNLAQGMSLRPGVRVELYTSANAFVAAALTDASGAYSFAGQLPGSYKVRVVNAFVTSSRAGGCTPSVSLTAPPATCTQLPVQTYVNGDAARVGGEIPSAADPALSTATLPAGAESLTTVTLGSTNFTGADFGFNFDAVVNKNPSGQGSLAQFVTNADALGNTGLAQSGNRQNAGVNQALPAGVETSIFMASDGAVHPGLRSGLTSQLTGGVLVIDQSAGALPDVTGANSASTSIDGSTQTANVGNINSGLLGAGGTVGYISTLTLDQVQRPEVEIVGASTVATGINLLSNNDQVRGVAVRGFGNASNAAGQANVHIGDNYTGTLIEQNFLGFSATAAALCNNATTVASGKGDNIRSDGGDNGTVQNNLISCAGGKGFGVESASAGWQILDNEIRANAIGSPTLDGVDLENAGSGTATVRGNLITQNGGVGVDGYQGGGSNTITQNSIVGNGFGQAGTPNETPGVRLYSPGSTVKNNLIASNYGAGVMVTGGVSGNLISQNSIYNNGALPAANGSAASGQIGIDLLLPADSVASGAQGTPTTPLYVTKNDSGDADVGGNDLLNFPVFQSATIQGANLIVTGYARPGSTVELFVAAPDPSGFGEGQTYLFTGKEGSAADTDAGTGSYNAAPGTDTTNRFQFTLPLPAGVALGTPLTATASCLASDCAGTTVVSNSTSEFSYNILVKAAPIANDDSASTDPGVPVTFSLSGNDTPNATLDLTSILLDASGPGTRTLSNGGKTLTVLGEGVYTVNPLNDGTVIFAPAAGFNSGTSTANYTVKDTSGVSSNVANITVTVPANVDLGIVKTGPAYFKPGDTVTYTLKVTSTGSAPAGIKVTDTLPAGLTAVTADNGGVVAGSTITWTLPATAPVTLSVTGTAPLTAADGSYSGATSLANTATVASTSAAQAENGAAATNNTSTTTSQLVYPRLSKRVRNLTTGGAFGTAGTGKPGEMLEYCIDFNNYGVAVNSFVLTDPVPANTNANPEGYGAGLGIQVNRAVTTTRTSASDGDGASLSTTTLSTSLGTLAAGESGSVCFQASIK